MPILGLETHIVDVDVHRNTVDRFRDQGILLPRFADLATPSSIDGRIRGRLAEVSPDAADPLNLFRVHWNNSSTSRNWQTVPEHIVIPPELSGVPAPIVLLFGDTFPMIRAHKVLAAYGCLAPRVITGQFDPTTHKAVWPSTGNYCRGGVAISRIMGCHGVAVLPEGMSRERFEWLERWVVAEDDIIATPGTESNVKEIYDRCAELQRQPENIIFNQFSEFGNYLAHYLCTGVAIDTVFESLAAKLPGARLAAFVSATGSAGTLAAGDHLKARHGTRIAAVEALECPTLLDNGFGEHNIQGIGDKHVPFIHNVMNTDLVVGVSDRATDDLGVLFNTPTGRAHLADRHAVPTGVLESLGRLGLSSICNLLASIKTARYLDLGPQDVIVTIATDGAEMYESERRKALERDFADGFDAVAAAETCGRYLLAATTDHLRELSYRERERIFNLGYFTWVEQQGITVEEFSARKAQDYWRNLQHLPAAWDEMIDEFNGETGVAASL